MEERVPSSQVARMREFGKLGAQLSMLLGQAGARSLFQRGAVREQLWDRTHQQAAIALFESLGHLRGAAAKLGQLLAQRPNLLPEQYIEAMFELSNRAPPMGYGMVKTQMMRELGRRPTSVFASFERRPFAAASFGQVHRAKLDDGTQLAVKVQYPAMEQSLESDFRNLGILLAPIERVLAVDGVREAFDEVRTHIQRELDYRLEAASIAEFCRELADEPELRFPEVHAAYSTRRILTMSLLEGTHIAEFLARGPCEELRQRHARQLLRFGWRSAFGHGLLHADPNPGNYVFTEDGALGVLDFGCVKRFSPELRAGLRQLMRAILHDDATQRDAALEALGLFASPAQREEAQALVEVWARPFVDRSFDFGDKRYLDELIQLQDLLRRKLDAGASMSVPSELLFYGRHIVGQTYMLTRLGARGNFAELLAPMVED